MISFTGRDNQFLFLCISLLFPTSPRTKVVGRNPFIAKNQNPLFVNLYKQENDSQRKNNKLSQDKKSTCIFLWSWKNILHSKNWWDNRIWSSVQALIVLEFQSHCTVEKLCDSSAFYVYQHCWTIALGAHHPPYFSPRRKSIWSKIKLSIKVTLTQRKGIFPVNDFLSKSESP